jgi:hypothetical protein
MKRKVYEPTGVILEVLFADAQKLGIDLDQESIYSLGRKCDELSRSSSIPYPKKQDFILFNAYSKGAVIGTKLTKADLDKLKTDDVIIGLSGIRHSEKSGVVSEPEYNDVEYRKAMSAYSDHHAVIRQVFTWGLFYLSGIMDNHKAPKLFSIAYEKGHSSGFQEVANEFDDMLELIK